MARRELLLVACLLHACCLWHFRHKACFLYECGWSKYKVCMGGWWLLMHYRVQAQALFGLAGILAWLGLWEFSKVLLIFFSDTDLAAFSFGRLRQVRSEVEVIHFLGHALAYFWVNIRKWGDIYEAKKAKFMAVLIRTKNPYGQVKASTAAPDPSSVIWFKSF